MKTTKKKIVSDIIGTCLVGMFFLGTFILTLILSFQNHYIDYRLIIIMVFSLLASMVGFLDGISKLKNAFYERRQKQLVLSKGKTYWGKIKGYAYENDKNNTMQYLLVLRVRYLNDNGEIREINIPTYEYNPNNYPITYNIPFKLYRGFAVLTGSATTQKIRGEDDLLLDGMDVTGKVPTVIAICPNCGGEVRVPVGMGAKCTYCGMILRTDRYGRVVKTR